jgi:hypothetical protein
MESALTISPLKASASEIAAAVFPMPVGPHMTAMLGFEVMVHMAYPKTIFHIDKLPLII